MANMLSRVAADGDPSKLPQAPQVSQDGPSDFVHQRCHGLRSYGCCENGTRNIARCSSPQCVTSRADITSSIARFITLGAGTPLWRHLVVAARRTRSCIGT